ncbi:MAG TPA: hypothetical protein VF059_01970 [Casimicrobiaceae bacterium]
MTGERPTPADAPRVQSFAPREAQRGPRAERGDEPPRRKAKTTPAAFLGGAIGRLLPASIPFRYFGAAVVFHLGAWLTLLAGADGAPRFRGGLGWPLASLHLLTLGVLVMTALGASMQLFPVATRQSVHSRHAPALIWWLYTPGVAVAAAGMGLASAPLLVAGALLVALALAIYAVVLARNLFGARGMPAVVAHGWAAWGSLAIVLIAALSLALSYVGAPALPRGAALALHVPFAGYGFMGMLALGLSYIVVPMFALSQPPDERQALASCALAIVALVLGAVAAFGVAVVALRVTAVAVGSVAVALHLRLMLAALRTGMRRDLGRSFRLVRIGWAMLGASLAAALGVAANVPFDGMGTLFGLALIVGWLLTFLLGILQRIVPFLASMHAARGRHLPPTPSSLGAGPALRVHYVCHLAALGALGAAIGADSPWLVRAGAAAGTIGAIAFCVFFATVVKRMVEANLAAKAGAVAA